MPVAKRDDGNRDEGPHRRVVLWGLENGPKRGKNIKNWREQSETMGKPSEKMGKPSGD